MIAYLLCAAQAIDANYSLVPPFTYTNLSEINTWSIVGSASNLKRYLRLTDAVVDDVGRICQRIPTVFEEWTVELEISAHGGNTGDSIVFFFTENFCPNWSKPIRGIHVVINRTMTDTLNKSKVFLFVRDRKVAEGSIAFAQSKEPTRIRFTKKGSSFDIEDVLSAKDLELPMYGYFGVMARTTMRVDNHDLYGIRTVPLLKANRVLDKDYDRINRKQLSDNVASRRDGKMRRRSKMLFTDKYMRAAKLHKQTLSDEKQELKEAFALIKESDVRAGSSVTIRQLTKFIDSKLKVTVDKALHKVNLAAERFDETKLSLDEVWSDLKTKLADLSIEAEMTMKKMGQEALAAAKGIKIAEGDSAKAVKMADEAEPKSMALANKLMALICVTEFIAYVIFFFHKRKQTHGFKKVD